MIESRAGFLSVVNFSELYFVMWLRSLIESCLHERLFHNRCKVLLYSGVSNILVQVIISKSYVSIIVVIL